ncbi:MAG TPA: hypothetical protein VN605_03525, partial [Thermoanaerobaculia bacterium]|nr:hypothetical protein [Thermoanaerobaculia bacterium]
HGVFDDRASEVSMAMELNKRRPWLLGAAGVGVGLALLLLKGSRVRKPPALRRRDAEGPQATSR